jgi:hypothetical protein
MSNASANVNSDCIKAQASDQQWRCNMAQYTLPFIKTPIFAFQSKYDSWQAGCVLSAEPVLNDVPGVNGNCSAVPGWYNCSQYVEDCTSEQIMNYNMFASAMTALLQTNLKKVDGLFLVSCHTHCEAHTDNDWMRFQINGISVFSCFRYVSLYLSLSVSALSFSLPIQLLLFVYLIILNKGQKHFG